MDKARFLSWAYVLFLGVTALPMLGVWLARIAPISSAQVPPLILFSLLVSVFWALNLQVVLRGFNSPIELSPWFLFTLALLQGPAVAYAAYFFGTSFYSIFFLFRPARAKIATIVINTFSYGAAFLVGWTFLRFDLANPFPLILSLAVVMALQSLVLFIIFALYLALAENQKYLEVLSSLLQTFFVDAIGITVFPGLIYMTVVFWQAHFYLNTVLFLIAFLLLRRAMQSVFKAMEEIVNTIEAIVIVIEAKDPYTHYHCNRVSLYAMAIAKFCGLNESFMKRIGNAARLHDVGKVLIPDRVLKKEGGLTDEEYGQIKMHADPNKMIMNKIPDGIPLKELIDVGRHHHERYDGKGYPDRLEGEAIPVEVRIIAAADAWDAMTSDRVYRPGLSHEKALSELEKYKGKQWDPVVVQAFKEAYDQGAIEEVVRNPLVLQNPPRSWSVPLKPLPYLPQKTEESPSLLYTKRRSIFFFFALLLVFASLYFAESSPLYHEPILFFAALASLLEIWELRLPKLPRFCPAEAVYLAGLFVVPLKGLLALMLFGFLVRSLYTGSFEGHKWLQFFQRLVFFIVSVPFFQWLGLQSQGELKLPRIYFQNALNSVYLLGLFCLWGAVYSALMFFVGHVKTMIRRRLWKVRWSLRALELLMLFQVGLVAPFALMLCAFLKVDSRHTPYLFLSFALLLVLTRPLIDYFRKVIEGNTKTIEALAGAADEKFPFYRGHSKRVTALAKEIAARLGMSDPEIESLELACKIYGLGNVGVPDEILNKPGKLTSDEERLMRQHVEISGQIAAQYSFYKEEVPLIWSHHERWDGNGYPSRLIGEAIPLGARILAVADGYCALISDRPHRKAFLPAQAIGEIERESETHYDPKVVGAFRKIVENV